MRHHEERLRIGNLLPSGWRGGQLSACLLQHQPLSLYIPTPPNMLVVNMTTNQDQNQSGIGGATNSAPPIKVSLLVGRWSNTIEHRWLFSIRKNGWVRSHCHRGLDWACDYYVLPGKYLRFSLSGYLDSRGAELSITEVAVDQDGLHEGKTLLVISLPYQYYHVICNDPAAPEVIRDFLAGRPLHYHSVSSNAPAKTYPPLDFVAIKRYFTELVVDS